MSRRSGRIKGPRAVYINDPFETAGISDESSSERETPSSKRRGKRRKDEESSSDDEFVTRGSDEEMDARADDDEVSEDEAIGDDLDAMEVDDSDFTPRRQARRTPASRVKAIKKRPVDSVVVPPGEETHVRGILDPKDHVAKTMHYVMTFGADDRDLVSSIYLRDRWFRGIDACLPSRVSLESYDQGPDYEYGPTFGVHPDDVERERTSGWDWYYDGDGERFRKRQRVDKIKEADARRTYLPKPKKGKHTILIGPADKQKPIRLGHHESFNFGEPWRDFTARRSDQAAQTTVREGWLLSIGHKVQCMAWAPNQDGLTQYMAVVAPITDEQKKPFHPPESEPLSPFKPSPPYPCALQLWEIKGKKALSKTNILDMNDKPRLRLTLCTEWGDIRRMAWCPMSRKLREQDEKSDAKSIGLLAGVWSDGKVRVLDVKIRKGSVKAEFVKVGSPVFEARPSSSMCTCVTWLSPSDIAVGCSNGFVAIWNIAPSTTTEPQPPYFYQPIHTTYVVTITSAYPTHPHLLSTIGMDGETRLWSMTDPHESVSTPRMRIASPVLSYSPVLFSVISSDENNFGRLMPIRRFFGSGVVGRMPNTVSSLAPCSFWHPSLLFGCTGGEVIAISPARRLLYSKEQQWQQIWFSHDWVQGPETDNPGISRFYDGYRAESQNLARNLAGEKRPILGITLTTIHDESTHVTALGWNPNRPCAAWASAALGCGLVRIEDLAI